MKKRRFTHFILLTLLLLAGAGVVRAWFYIDAQVQPILMPLNQAYEGYSPLPKKVPGLRMEPFVFKGWDGGDVQAVIAEREGEESSRQLTVMSALSGEPVRQLHVIDYVLICVDWDHGVRSALPLAETLTAAGLRCVLWEPRGYDNRRLYCTHGLKESGDISLLIDALAERSGKKSPVIIAVGQGYGAGLLLHATARESRVQGLVCIDAYASLRQSVKRTMPQSPLSPLVMELMNLRTERLVGMECFDVAPVEQASYINRHVPVLVMNLVQDNPVRTLADALSIYRSLQSDTRAVWSLCADDAVPELTPAQQKCLPELRRFQDEDSAMIAMIHWLDGPLADAVQAPRVADPARPVPQSNSHL